MSKEYFVYIISNTESTTIYTGVTNNLIRRIYEHKQKLVEGFTKKYHLTKLVYYESSNDIVSAITREKAIKNLVRRKKDELIEKVNPEWKDLYPKII